jgi:outer membrane immunogenic protein
MAPAPYVAVPVFTWTGLYFGVNAGYAWNNNDRDNRFTLDSNAVFLGSPAGDVIISGDNGNNDGFAGGAQIGWNYQFTPGSGFVVGIEADIQGIDLNNNDRVVTFTGPVSSATFLPVGNGVSSLDWFGTVRGRLGYAFDRVLVYGTGGFAYGGGDSHGCPVGFSDPACNNGDDTRTGYTVGGGFEWALPVTASLFGSSAMTFGVEGLYVNLNDDNNRGNLAGFNVATGAPVFVTGRNNDNDTEFGVVRAKINFKF